MRRKWSDISPLGRYILDLCYRERYSMREASLAANLSEGTLSKIVRRGNTTRPHPDTLKALSDVLHGNYAEMLRLAGYAEPRHEAQIAEMSPELRSLLDSLAELERESPESAKDVVAAIFTLIEAAGAANRANPLPDNEVAESALEQPVLSGLPDPTAPFPTYHRRRTRADIRKSRERAARR